MNSNFIQQICIDHNIRLTARKITIINVIVDANKAAQHPDVEEIYDIIKNVDKNVSIPTIYRFLSDLVEKDIIEKHNFGDGKARYEFAQLKKHHDHIIDVDTKEIIEFFDDEIEKMKMKIAKSHGYDLIDHRLELRCRKIKK